MVNGQKWTWRLIVAWWRVAVANFPHYRFSYTKFGRRYNIIIVFLKTGHALHFLNPRGELDKSVTRYFLICSYAIFDTWLNTPTLA